VVFDGLEVCASSRARDDEWNCCEAIVRLEHLRIDDCGICFPTRAIDDFMIVIVLILRVVFEAPQCLDIILKLQNDP
jgi:hypothetical protein